MGYAQTAADYLARAGQEMSFPGLALGPDNAIDLILKSGVHLESGSTPTAVLCTCGANCSSSRTCFRPSC